VAVCALPLFAVGTAQAAIAGGNPSTSNNLPDVRSAAALDSSDVQVCFDKALSPSSAVLSNSSRIYLVGYNSFFNDESPIGATLDQKNNACIDLAFNTNSGSLDLGQFTAATVTAGAVQALAGGLTNYADSTTLTTSTTHNGTVGLSTGPDLSGPAPGATANSIAFVFDQNVDPTSVNGTGFFYENSNGQMCESTSAVASGSTVTATFSTTAAGTCADTLNGNGTSSVSNARRVFVNQDAVFNVSSDEIGNTPQGTNMPTAANGGATNLASLQSAALQGSSNQVSYTFDHPLNGALNNAADFFVTLSNGDFITGNSVTGGSSANSVVVTFSSTNLQLIDEYAVQAGVVNGAAQASPGSPVVSNGTSFTNSPGTVPIGGNPNAFARGFTTGPDAFAVAFDLSKDVATIFFDQRVSGDQGVNGITFLNANGNVVGNPTTGTVVVPNTPNPGPVAVTMDLSAAVAAQSPTQIALDMGGFNCEFFTSLSSNDACSIPQIVAVTGSGAHIKAIKVAHKAHKASKHHKAHKHHKAKKAHKAH